MVCLSLHTRGMILDGVGFTTTKNKYRTANFFFSWTENMDQNKTKTKTVKTTASFTLSLKREILNKLRR